MAPRTATRRPGGHARIRHNPPPDTVIFMANERAGAGPENPLAGAGPVRALVLTVRFGTELALLAVLAVAGASAPAPLAVRVILAVAGRRSWPRRHGAW